MSTEQTLEVLMRVRSLIAAPEHWLQGQFAVRADGEGCSPQSPAATRFCLEGAFWRITGSCDLQEPQLAVLQASGAPSLIAFNDACGHCEVLRAVDAAIEKYGAARVSATWQKHFGAAMSRAANAVGSDGTRP